MQRIGACDIHAVDIRRCKLVYIRIYLCYAVPSGEILAPLRSPRIHRGYICAAGEPRALDEGFGYPARAYYTVSHIKAPLP